MYNALKRRVGVWWQIDDSDSLGGSFDSVTDSVTAESLWSARTRPITAALNTLRGDAGTSMKKSDRHHAITPARSVLKELELSRTGNVRLSPQRPGVASGMI